LGQNPADEESSLGAAGGLQAARGSLRETGARLVFWESNASLEAIDLKPIDLKKATRYFRP
jgi:hypothetical protein